MSSTTGACAPGASTSGLGEPGGRSIETWISHWVPFVITPIVGSGDRPGFPAGGGPTGGGGVGAVTTDHWPDGGGGGGPADGGGPGGGGGGGGAADACRCWITSPVRAPTSPPIRAPSPRAPAEWPAAPPMTPPTAAPARPPLSAPSLAAVHPARRRAKSPTATARCATRFPTSPPWARQ